MPSKEDIEFRVNAKATELKTQANLKADQLKEKASELKDELKQKIPSSTEELKQDVVNTTKAAASDFQKSIRSLVAGGVGGVCAVLTGHPFDLVKVRLQTAEKGVYTGAMDVVRKIVAKGGPMGMYAGVTAPLAGVTPMFAISFWGYDLGKTLVNRTSTVSKNLDGSPNFTLAQISTAGFISAIPMTIITAPMERVKVLLQIQGSKTLKPGEKPQYAGSMDCAKQLYREGGIKSVYRGTFMTLARDGPGSAAYFATYEAVKRYLTPKDPITGAQGQLSLLAVMGAGAAAGVAMWIPVFPVDTVKSRVQSLPGKPTVGGVVRGLYASGGLKAFFPGIGPAMARAVPANAATFLGVELAQQAMSRALD